MTIDFGHTFTRLGVYNNVSDSLAVNGLWLKGGLGGGVLHDYNLRSTFVFFCNEEMSLGITVLYIKRLCPFLYKGFKILKEK